MLYNYNMYNKYKLDKINLESKYEHRYKKIMIMLWRYVMMKYPKYIIIVIWDIFEAPCSKLLYSASI